MVSDPEPTMETPSDDLAPKPRAIACGRCGQESEVEASDIVLRMAKFSAYLCEECLESQRRAEQAEELERAKAERIQANLGLIPPRFGNIPRLDNTAVLKWVKQFLVGQSESLYLEGPVGTGKTHLVWAAWRAIAETGYEGTLQAWRVSSLLDALRPNRSEDDLVGMSQRAGLLILDDLGAEKPSEWAAERLYEIIDERYLRLRPLVVTTNLPANKVVEAVGDRTASRLAEMCQVVTVKGPDRRRHRTLALEKGSR